MNTPKDRETWERMSTFLDQAFELNGEALTNFLDEIEAESPSMRAAVESMLAADSEQSGLLDQTLDQVAGPLLGDDSEDHGTLPAGTLVGNYRIIREIGHGGMGRVYEAERADGAFDQKVALKVIRSGLSWGPLRDRFLQERQILASLNHPNLSRLLDGGVTEDGRPYFAMEIVEGRPIDEYASEHRLDLQQRLRLFANACSAVAHAQQRLVVHRDLKPSNILVTPEGTVKLLDFGIARLLGTSEDPGLTRIGPTLLTPEYATPEQIAGEAITTATDVFALGRVLAELIEPHGDADHKTSLARDLKKIIDKACFDDPEQRYATAADLEEDIRRYLSGFPIKARRPALGYVASRFVARNKIAVGAAVALLVTLLAGIVTTTWQAQKAKQSAAQATTAQLQAETARADTQSINRVLLNMLASASPINDGRNVRVVDVLSHAESEVRMGENLSDEARIAVLTTLSATYLGLRQLDDSERLLNELLADQALIAGSEAEWRVNNQLARLYIERRDWQRAIEQSKHAIELAIRLDPNNERVLESETTLANAFAEHNDPAAAVLRLEQALLAFPDASPDLLGMARMALGRLYDMQAQLEEAREQYAQAAELFEHSSGFQNANTIAARSSLGTIIGRLGDGPRGAEILREQLAIAIEFLGPEHKTTFNARLNLGAVLAEHGETAESLEVQRGVYASSVRAFGDDGLFSILSRGNMATQLVILGETAEAESIYKDNIERLARAHPDEHNYRLIQAFNLAELLNELGRFEESRVLAASSLEEARLHLGEVSIVGMELFESIARSELGMGNLDIAEQAFSESVASKSEHLGEGHPLTLNAMVRQGDALVALGRTEEARALYDRVLEGRSRVFGADHAETQAVLQRLAGL